MQNRDSGEVQPAAAPTAAGATLQDDAAEEAGKKGRENGEEDDEEQEHEDEDADIDDEDEDDLAERFTEAFNQVDVDNEGSILAEQLGTVLEILGLVVGQDELEELVADMTDDVDGASGGDPMGPTPALQCPLRVLFELQQVGMLKTDLAGIIMLDDFVEVMIARHKGQELSDEELREAFSVFDVDDIGFITAKDVRAVLLLLLDLQTKPSEIDDMFKATTKDPQGRVTFEEFRDIIKWKPPTTRVGPNQGGENQQVPEQAEGS